MSKQSDAKAAQQYEAKPVPATCVNCAHFRSAIELPAWVKRDVAAGKKTWDGKEYTIEQHGREGNLRCGLGGFAVKKMATCNAFNQKPQEQAK